MLDWGFMIQTIFGFGDSLINWVTFLYKNITGMVKTVIGY